MKLKIMLAVGVLAFGFAAHAQQDTSDTSKNDTSKSDTTTTKSTMSNTNSENSDTAMDSGKNASDLSPKDVCQRLAKLDATKTTNNAEINKWLYGESHGKMHADTAMHQSWVRQVISAADCKSETIAGDHAFVIAQSGDLQRLLPFVKDNGIWKIDVPVYRVFYRKEMRLPASKDAKDMLDKDMPSK